MLDKRKVREISSEIDIENPFEGSHLADAHCAIPSAWMEREGEGVGFVRLVCGASKCDEVFKRCLTFVNVTWKPQKWCRQMRDMTLTWATGSQVHRCSVLPPISAAPSKPLSRQVHGSLVNCTNIELTANKIFPMPPTDDALTSSKTLKKRKKQKNKMKLKPNLTLSCDYLPSMKLLFLTIYKLQN